MPRSLLSAAQLAEYETAVKLATRFRPGSSWDQKTIIEPANITQEDPFLLPYVYEGRVFLASLGHFTIGWRYFADWDVTFKALDRGKLTPQARFAVGMTKREPQNVAVFAVQ